MPADLPVAAVLAAVARLHAMDRLATQEPPTGDYGGANGDALVRLVRRFRRAGVVDAAEGSFRAVLLLESWVIKVPLVDAPPFRAQSASELRILRRLHASNPAWVTQHFPVTVRLPHGALLQERLITDWDDPRWPAPEIVDRQLAALTRALRPYDILDVTELNVGVRATQPTQLVLLDWVPAAANARADAAWMRRLRRLGVL